MTKKNTLKDPNLIAKSVVDQVIDTTEKPAIPPKKKAPTPKVKKKP